MKKKIKMPPRDHTRIQIAGSVKNARHARLTVPAHIARLVGTDRLFKVELTDEGILYRYVEGGEPVTPMPLWLRMQDMK